MNKSNVFRKMISFLIVFAVIIAALTCLFFYIKKNYTVKNTVIEGNFHYTGDEIKSIVESGRFGNNTLYLKFKYRNREITDIPFIQTIDVSVESKDSIHIYVYEKTLAGFVEYLGRYVYFDKDGVAVEVSNVKTAGVPEVVGVSFDYIVLHEKIPAKDEDLFRKVLDITRMLTKYKVDASKMYFKSNNEIVLYKDKIVINLGKEENLDIKIMNLPSILEKLEGKSGILRMENYNEDTKRVSFEPD